LTPTIKLLSDTISCKDSQKAKPSPTPQRSSSEAATGRLGLTRIHLLQAGRGGVTSLSMSGMESPPLVFEKDGHGESTPLVYSNLKLNTLVYLDLKLRTLIYLRVNP